MALVAPRWPSWPQVSPQCPLALPSPLKDHPQLLLASLWCPKSPQRPLSASKPYGGATLAAPGVPLVSFQCPQDVLCVPLMSPRCPQSPWRTSPIWFWLPFSAPNPLNIPLVPPNPTEELPQLLLASILCPQHVTCVPVLSPKCPQTLWKSSSCFWHPFGAPNPLSIPLVSPNPMEDLPQLLLVSL